MAGLFRLGDLVGNYLNVASSPKNSLKESLIAEKIFKKILHIVFETIN